MDNLPIELIQYINEKLDYIDQLNFKSISQGFYDCIKIKQQLPYLLTLDRFHNSDDLDYTYYRIIPMDCFRLDEFYRMNQKYLENKYLWDYDVYVLNSNKYIQKPPNICEFDEFDYSVSYNKDKDSYNSCNEDYGLEYGISTIYINFKNDRSKIWVDYKPCNQDGKTKSFNLRTFVQKCIDRANGRN